MSPRLHANGSMVYTFKNSGGEDLFIMENGKQRALDKADRDQTRPIWSNDKVVYFSNEHGEENWDIYVTDLNGSRKKFGNFRVRLPIKGTPALSSDKEWIAMVQKIQKNQVPYGLQKLMEPKLLNTSRDWLLVENLLSLKQMVLILLAFTALPSKRFRLASFAHSRCDIGPAIDVIKSWTRQSLR